MMFGKRQPPGYRGINPRSHFTREPVDMPAEILFPGQHLANAASWISPIQVPGFLLKHLLGVPEGSRARSRSWPCRLSYW